MPMARRSNFQSVGWLHDLYTRGLLNMDPPYQRRSVWNQEYKNFFVDTVLHDFPCPAIFLFEKVKPDGRSLFAVVDGKQRLSSLFEFVRGDFPVPESISNPEYQGKYFGDLPNDAKTAFWRYQFSVEYIPHEDETLINSIFDRINRNVAKLSAQELRHAKLDGIFINEAERLTEWMSERLPRNFPNIPDRYKRQMKDVEFISANPGLQRQRPRDTVPSRCCEFVDSRLRRSPPDRASAVSYGQAGENAMRSPTLPTGRRLPTSFTAPPQQHGMNLIPGKVRPSAGYQP